MPKHKSLRIWEDKLKRLFDSIDDLLEDKYGNLFPLHPRRSKRYATSNKEQDGLFNVGASFTLGFGSRYGPGYIVDVRFSTLTRVPVDVRNRIEDEVADLLNQKLPEVFPGRHLEVAKDGRTYKIFGNLSLGKL
jgi:hypothetical protein